ncbi:MAG: IS110 family transposase [Pusillimonas sp.]
MQDVLNIGVDVAKAELVIAVQDHPECSATISNHAAPITRWLRTLPTGSRIAVESTGEYHRELVSLAQQHGFSTYVLNARDVYFYAKALGQRGKTDRTDAQVISRYLREHHAHLYRFAPGGATEQEINRLLRRRVVVVAQRDSLEHALQGLQCLDKPVRQLLAQFDAVLTAMDQEVQALIQGQAELAAASTQLQTVPGIGPQGAALLTCLFRRIGFSNADAVVAFSGLDPRPMDSGQKRGRRRLSKRGPALLRRQLYMMAFSASRTRAFKPVYQALRARGVSSTAAFVILGRKLLRIAFALWRTKTDFEMQRWEKNTCTQL